MKKLEFDQMLDREYEKLQKILESDELSNEEKLRSYEKYRENAHDELGEVTGNGTNLKNQMSREFIDAFLR